MVISIVIKMNFNTVKINCQSDIFCEFILTSGVKRNLIPSTEPFRVSPLIRNMVRTTQGNVEVTYTALRGQIKRSCLSSSNIRYKANSLLNALIISQEFWSLLEPYIWNIAKHEKQYQLFIKKNKAISVISLYWTERHEFKRKPF